MLKAALLVREFIAEGLHAVFPQYSNIFSVSFLAAAVDRLGYCPPGANSKSLKCCDLKDANKHGALIYYLGTNAIAKFCTSAAICVLVQRS